jgi:hypothetical protein
VTAAHQHDAPALYARFLTSPARRAAQVAELLSERRLDCADADAVAIADVVRRLGKVLCALPEQRVEAPPQDVAEYLQRLGLPQACSRRLSMLHTCHCSVGQKAAG